MKLYDSNKEPIRDTYVGFPVPVFLWIPPILFYDYQYNTNRLIRLLKDESWDTTDDEGMIEFYIRVGPGWIGTYTLSFEYGTNFYLPL